MRADHANIQRANSRPRALGAGIEQVGQIKLYGMTKTLAFIAILTLAACSAAPPSKEQRAAAVDDLNPSGRPYDGPRGLRSTFPPADSSSTPLKCHLEGPGQVCTRSGD